MDQLSPITKMFLAATAGALFGCILWKWFWVNPEDELQKLGASDLLRARILARRKAEEVEDDNG
jgi:hypothetical protein